MKYWFVFSSPHEDQCLHQLRTQMIRICAAYNYLPRAQEAKTNCSKSSFESSPQRVYKNITALTQSLEKGRSWRKSFKNGWMMLLDLFVLCSTEEEFSEHDAEDEDDEGSIDVGSGQHLVLGTDRRDCCRTVAWR